MGKKENGEGGKRMGKEDKKEAEMGRGMGKE